MSHRVIGLYHHRDKAHLALGDLQATGLTADRIRYAEGLTEGSGRIEVEAKDLDQAIDVRTFLEQDGADSVIIQSGDDEVGDDTMPSVPARY